jgi:DNA-binding MarR family transcriptional regulator
MGETPGREGLAAWRAFLEAHARVTAQLERELVAAHGFGLPWYDVLVQLNEAPDRRLRMTELASAVLLSKSGLTRVIDRMLEAGLVQRHADQDDRRGVVVTLTERGWAQLRTAAPTHLEGVQRHFAALLDSDEARVIAAALGRVAERAGVR